MSNTSPIDFSLDLLQSGKPLSGAASDGVNTSPEALFKDVLADEKLVSEVMSRLKELLPEDIFAQIEEMVESGNGLPIAAIFSPESPLFEQISEQLPQMVRDAFKHDGGQIPAILASAINAGDEKLQKTGDAASRTLDNIGRQISEALSTLSDKGQGSDIGRQIQDLLGAAKAEIVSADVGAKSFLAATAGGGELTSTQTNTINSAISGLAQVQTASPQGSGASVAPPPITTPMGEEAWGQAMGDRIMWMVGKGVQAASIRINPPDLGPIHVRLSVNNDQTSVQMLVQNGVVKEALEAAMPRLREMLQEGNMYLVNVDVSHRESPDQSSGSGLYDHDQNGQMEQFLQDQELAGQIEEELPRYYRSSGLLDDYA